MRLRITLIAFAAAATAVALAPGSAGATAGCPGDMTPTPAAFVNNGDQKDKAPKDGVICAKPAPECVVAQHCPGGPDYDMFGTPLLGLDGNWYYVTDNSL